MLYERIRIPFAGVIPYMDVDVDDEDSLSERLTKNMEPDLFLTAPAMRLLRRSP